MLSPKHAKTCQALIFFFPRSRLSNAMNFDHFPIDRLRPVPLDTVLTLRGPRRDRHDRAKWHTERGPLSIADAKFFNWHQDQGGGGAIDLVMHLAGVDCRTARIWLASYASAGLPTTALLAVDPSGGKPATVWRPDALRLPQGDPRRLARVRHCLTHRRGPCTSLLEPLLELGQLYADSHAKVVFVLVAGKARRAVGAKLRGTGPRVWRAMAFGSNKDLGYFWIGARAAREIVLCESAIAALSTVRRLRPSAHDWNDVLTSH